MTRDPAPDSGEAGDSAETGFGELGETAAATAGIGVRDGASVDPGRERALGLGYGFTAHLLWGFLPLYFVLLAPTGPWELVAWRILLSLVFCALLLTVTRAWRRLGAVFRSARTVWLTVAAGLLIYVNWQVFIIGTLTGHVLETSLGYFINPLVTVLLGVLVLRERLRLTQWIALGIAALAIVVIVVGYGSVPWIALLIALSFGAYGLVKKQVGPSVDAVSGLTLETLWLTPVAAVMLVLVSATTGLTMGTGPWQHTLLLSLVGVITAVPLLLFAAAARRVSLTALGLLQFVTPILQFLTGWLLLGEPMPVERWIGFALVWVALIVLTVDSVLHARRARRA